MKRFAIWIGVLAVAVAAGFGLGALTYVPPGPEMDSPAAGPATSPEPTISSE